MHKFKNLLLYLLQAFTIVILYIELSHFWVSCGGVDGNMKYIELPIILALLLLFYFPNTKHTKNAILSSLSIIALYVLFDVFYHFLDRSPRVSDILNIGVLSDFSLILSLGALTLFIFVIAPFLYILSKAKSNLGITILKITIFIGLIFLLNSKVFEKYMFQHYKFYSWSQTKSIKKNGHISSFLYYNAISRLSKIKLATYKNKKIDINRLLFKNIKLKKRPNIYMVVLESFIDPRLIKDATFNKSPLYEGMKKYLKNGKFSYVISPVYGGGTAQAEFELLTGVKALAKVNSIEFNTLEGEQISGFTDLLKKNGYHTYAIIATYSGYYNSKEAYKSIGFDNTVFLEECKDFHKSDDDQKIFDGDMYRYILKKIHNKTYKKPFFCYALGMYGHFPYDRNLKKRADMINTTHKDKRVQKIANQFYYRTKALSEYLDAILKNDPNSIIYISSDHIPPLLTNGVSYLKSKKENISLLLINGKPIDVSKSHYYDIPRKIYGLINNDSAKLKNIDNNLYEDIYFKELSESLQM